MREGRADGCIKCNSLECVCAENSSERECCNANISQYKKFKISRLKNEIFF